MMESSCDSASIALRKCPFLAKVAAQNGVDYARSVALRPTDSVGQQKLPEGQDAQEQYAASFQLFHGPAGIVPLVNAHESASARSGCPFHMGQPRQQAIEGCPFAKSSKPPTRPLPLATISLSFGSGPNFGELIRKQLQKHHGSNKPRPSKRHQQPPASSNSANQGPNGPGGSAASSHPSSNPSNPGSFKPQRPLTDPCVGGSGSSGSLRSGVGAAHGPPPAAAANAAGAAGHPAGPGMQLGSTAPAGISSSSIGSSCSALGSSSGTFSTISSSNGLSSSAVSPYKASASTSSSRGTGSVQNQSSGKSGGAAGGPRGPNRPAGKGLGSNSANRIATGSSASSGAAPVCPLRKWLGPMAGLIFNDYDKLICPPPIVAARAALAKTAAVQQLRPQKLPVKLVAVAAVAAASNMPCGAVREHFEKFSVGWFIAVHATIPFVAMLRKAVIMPKFAMLVTFTAAIMGQMIGARIERARLQHLQQQGLPDPLLSWMQNPANTAAAGASATVVGSNSGSDGSKVVHNAGWRQKLLAGGKAGLAEEANTAPRLGSSSCSGSDVVVGLGSFLPQLPVVKA